MKSSSSHSARIIRPGDVTVVGRPGAAATRPASTAGAAAAAAWKPDELAGFAFTFGGKPLPGEPEPSLSTAPSPIPLSAMDLVAAELDAAREEAFAAGVAEGRAAAERESAARVTIAVLAVEGAVEAVREEERRWVGNAEENLVALAIAVAHHVIEREIAVDDGIVRSLVSRALAEFPLAQPVTVRLHPDDLVLLQSAPDGAIGP